MEKNLTNGSILKTIIMFSLPFLMSYLLQTLYGLADLFIIGQFDPTESTTAVSIGSQVMHMLTVMIVGLAMGATVLIGKAVGSGDTQLKNKAIGNTIVLFIIISVCFTAILLMCVSLIVRVMSTPDEAVRGTRQYLMICFAGIPFITMYNIICSVYRGMGDSKSPMYFVAVACICNILLDYIFIGLVGLGPAGAALGTTLSQGISVIISVCVTVKKQMITGLKKEHFKLQTGIISNILKVGLPIMAQDAFIQISFIVITIFANRRGLSDSAAVGIVEKLIGILFLVPSTLLSSVSAICAQNIGAGKDDRARRTMWDSVFIAVGCGMFFAILFQFVAAQAVGLFSSDPEVIRLGDQYMRSYVWDCVFAGIHFVFSGYFCALSRSGLSFIHNITSALVARIPIAYYTSIRFADTLYPMGWAAPIGSIVSVIICLIAYFYIRSKTEGDLRNDS
ncbi:MAG: MATE family efflux transporter [Lachnospiraceae bacterium]|nr:MATE family efflux transporter [Lachnospiraceae bacterium]